MDLDMSKLKKYYGRIDIQKEMVRASKNREISVKYGESGFGKRPDIITYPSDIGEFSKKNVTSFHVSEEIWQNPLSLSTDMKRKDLDDLRIGWDLVLDIDCPVWEISKIITWLLIKSLKDHGIKSVSVKFSGNKGFHIGVPSKAFPDMINEKKKSELFPEGPKSIALYLLDFISNNKDYIEYSNKTNEITFGNNYSFIIDDLMNQLKKQNQNFIQKICRTCGEKQAEKDKKDNSVEFICDKCGTKKKIDHQVSFYVCHKCNSLIKPQKISVKENRCSCGSADFEFKLNPLSIVEVDTILISSRHMYRMPYSINEKSGLASISFNPEKIERFEKGLAELDKVKISENYRFMDDTNADTKEGENLLQKALAFQKNEELKKESTNWNTERKYEDFFAEHDSVPVEDFPPCIKNLLKGVTDGRKRAVFILMNFLTYCGWAYNDIEKLLREWNEKNETPLKETLLLGPLRYHKKNKKRVLPPNCDNRMYFKDIGWCRPDNLCNKIKNPVNYSIRMTKNKKKTKKKTVLSNDNEKGLEKSKTSQRKKVEKKELSSKEETNVSSKIEKMEKDNSLD